MKRTKQARYDDKTGKTVIEDIDMAFSIASPPPQGIDIEKLKKVLLRKEIIKDKREIE